MAATQEQHQPAEGALRSAKAEPRASERVHVGAPRSPKTSCHLGASARAERDGRPARQVAASRG